MIPTSQGHQAKHMSGHERSLAGRALYGTASPSTARQPARQHIYQDSRQPISVSLSPLTEPHKPRGTWSPDPTWSLLATYYGLGSAARGEVILPVIPLLIRQMLLLIWVPTGQLYFQKAEDGGSFLYQNHRSFPSALAQRGLIFLISDTCPERRSEE